MLVVEATYQPVSGILSTDYALARQLGRCQSHRADFISVLGFGELV